MKIIDEFKSFAMRGSVIDLAVGVIIGGAFSKIVSSLVENVLMPPIGLLIGGINFSQLKVTLKAASTHNGVATPEVAINYGNFIQATLDFLLIAIAIFLFVKMINSVHQKKEAPAAPAPPAEEVVLLTQIRDLLQKENK